MPRTAHAWRTYRPLHDAAAPRHRRRLCRRNAPATHWRSPVRVAAGPRPSRAPRLPVPADGTANVFVAADAHQPRRYTKVTARRTAVDFAEWLRDLVDLHYAGTERILLVLTISRPIPRPHSTRPSRPLKPAASTASWSSLRAEARQLAEHGRDRHRHPVRAMPRPALPDLPTLTYEVDAGPAPAMPLVHGSVGCLASSRRAPKWGTPIRRSPPRRRRIIIILSLSTTAFPLVDDVSLDTHLGLPQPPRRSRRRSERHG